MNLYANVSEIKDVLSISAASDNTVLLHLLEAASRAIDTYCGRRFYPETATRCFDGGGTYLWIDDLLSVTTLKLDQDGDATFESTMASTDYNLYPLRTYPKYRVQISENSNYGSFASAIDRGVEIVGLWGYGDGKSATPYRTTSINVTADDATETTLDVSAEDVIEVGHTILVELEQMFVTAATTDGTKEITVERGINGTTGLAHAAKPASIYEYPKDVWQAAITMASQLYESRKYQGFKSEHLGDYSYTVADALLDKRLFSLLEPYRKVKVG